MPFADHMQRNRFELKYMVDEQRARGIRDFIRPYLIRDRFARPEYGWAYPIYSVYLDSPQLDLYNATLGGHKNRFKLRARYYDGNPANPVFLEIKRRVNDVIFKDRAMVKRPSVARLLAGAAPRPCDMCQPNNPDAYKAAREFHRLATCIGATGRTIVAYTREAYNARDNDDVRVTFDRQVAGSCYDDNRPGEDVLRVDRPWTLPPLDTGRGSPVANAEGVILELKFTGCYPRWMEELVRTFNLYRTSMAKYINCVSALGPQSDAIRRERWVGQQRRQSLV